MNRKRCFIFLILLMSFEAMAQDHLYSQFYNAPNYLNPALNGQFNGDLRVNMIYRNQWSGIPGPLNYYTFSADLNMPALNGGLGIMVTKSSEGSAYYSKTNLSGIYSYSVDLDNGALSFGLQFGFTNRKVDYDKLIFLDQLGPEGIIADGISAGQAPLFNNKFYFDSGTGVNLVWNDFMIGASAQHLNNPNESLTGLVSKLPLRYNGYASYKIPVNTYISDETFIIPSVVYNRQLGLNAITAGMQYKYKNANMGIWYRGNGKESDAFVVSLIFDLFSKRSDDKTRIGLSHDLTTSKVGYTRTAGSTEAAFNYETTFPGRGTSRKSYSNRCYDFY